MLVAMAGLRLESHTGDFEGVALGPGVQSQVVIASKPGTDATPEQDGSPDDAASEPSEPTT